MLLVPMMPVLMMAMVASMAVRVMVSVVPVMPMARAVVPMRGVLFVVPMVAPVMMTLS